VGEMKAKVLIIIDHPVLTMDILVEPNSHVPPLPKVPAGVHRETPLVRDGHQPLLASDKYDFVAEISGLRTITKRLVRI